MRSDCVALGVLTLGVTATVFSNRGVKYTCVAIALILLLTIYGTFIYAWMPVVSQLCILIVALTALSLHCLDIFLIRCANAIRFPSPPFVVSFVHCVRTTTTGRATR